MTFALPTWAAWLLIALTALAALAAFVIRPRPRRQVVASVAVWHRVLGDAHRRALWERIRWVVSAVLTVLVAAAIAAALARPARATGDPSAGRTLLVLDSSWSMRARLPDGGTRWERAIDEARAVADTSGTQEIAVATTADGIVEGPTGDRARIDRALNRLVPSGGPDGTWPRIADPGSTHFFTDGAVPRATGTDVAVHSVFVPAPNVAVTAFDVEPTTSGTGAQLLVGVANLAPRAQTVHLTVTRGAETLVDRSIPIHAWDTYRDVLPVAPTGEARFHAHVSAPENALDLDDDLGAWLWTAEPLRVGVVGGSNSTAALLAHDPTLRVSTIDPASYARSAADVWVFDRWLPATAPAQPALIIDPPPSDWLGARGTPEAQPAWGTQAPHPVVDGVETPLLRLGQARAVVRPALQTIAASQRDTPLVSVEDAAHSRYVVIGFAVQDASFTSTPAYPVLVGNALDWLGRPDRGVRHQVGRLILPASTRRIVAPSGQTVPLLTLDNHVSATVPAPGLYLVETFGGERVLSVGLDDPARSNLMSSTVAEGRPVSRGPRGDVQPWWVYCAAAALALSALEWVTWRRRVTI